jgi:uncharacterized membrane protein YhaH (DUF805 family)
MNLFDAENLRITISMFKILFGDIKAGHLRRLAFIGYWILLTVFMIGFGFAIILAIGAGETLIGGDLTAAQDSLRRWFSIPSVVIVSLIYMTVLFGHFNIVAKRIRDTGLPGWWSMLFIVILQIIITVVISEQGGQIFSLLMWLALLFIPGNTFGRGPNRLD